MPYVLQAAGGELGLMVLIDGADRHPMEEEHFLRTCDVFKETCSSPIG
jgi:hypothetical protein